jgi:hypothetical protein
MTRRSGARGRLPVLTDRRSERAVLDRFVAEVRTGEGRALVVRGEPGVLDALALLSTEGYPAAAPALKQAPDLLLALDADTDQARRWRFLAGGRIGMTIAMERCDWESLHILLAGQAQVARDMGALVQLRSATMGLAAAHIMQGELSARLVDEEHLIAEATGTPPTATNATMLAAWRGREQQTSELIAATAAWTPAPSSGSPTTCCPRWGRGRSPSAPGSS